MKATWLIGFLLLLAASPARAQEAMVEILAPAEGAVHDSFDPLELRYLVNPGPRGDHIHVYVDDEEIGVLRNLEGSYALNGLPMGLHNICIKIVNRGHTPIGVSKCVSVTVGDG